MAAANTGTKRCRKQSMTEFRGETMRSNNQPRIASRAARMALLSVLTLALLSLPALAQKVSVTNLTSDIPAAAAFQDTNLVNPWGMSISPSGPWWISDNGSGKSTLYVASGQAQSLVVTIPPGTGRVPELLAERFTTVPPTSRFTEWRHRSCSARKTARSRDGTPEPRLSSP